MKNPFGTCSSGGCDPANTYSCNGSGSASYGCNIMPMAQIQRDVQSLADNTSTSLVPTSWTRSGGGPFPNNETFAMALGLQSSSNPTSVSWVAGEVNTGEAMLLTGTNAGKIFPYSSATIDICAENRQCIATCFDATLANPSCPEGQSQFISAGCDVRPGGVYDPTHSTSCVQWNNVNTTSIPNILTQAPLQCSLLTATLCNSANGTDTWEEIFPQTSSGALATLVGVWNGTPSRYSF